MRGSRRLGTWPPSKRLSPRAAGAGSCWSSHACAGRARRRRTRPPQVLQCECPTHASLCARLPPAPTDYFARQPTQPTATRTLPTPLARSHHPPPSSPAQHARAGADPQKMLRTIIGSALLVSIAFGGICNDKRIDCANWAKDGECAGENAVRCAHTPQPGQDLCPGPAHHLSPSLLADPSVYQYHSHSHSHCRCHQQQHLHA